jgi:hypothetical protein
MRLGWFQPFIWHGKHDCDRYSIYVEGITQGGACGGYCPSRSVTRGQMAAFIIRANYGKTFSYTATPYFSDVLSNNVFFKYFQKLKDLAITSTVGTNGADNIVTREQMAAFLGRAFLGME